MITISLTDDTTAAGRWSLSSISYENQPLKLTANTGTDSKIKIAPNVVTNSDGTDTQAPPVSNLIASVSLSTHDLQTGATTGATFVGTTAPTTTVGQYRRVGYNLLASGSIQVIFSAAATSLAGLPNAGTVFIKSGLPIGWVDVEATAATAFKTIGSASAIVENMVGGVSRIHRFGAGGGGGGGTGDANAFQLELQDRLESSFFNCMTPNIISVDADKKIDASSTGTYDTANSVYSLPTVGQRLLSTQNYDATFLASLSDSLSAELQVLWSAVDTAATYELSRDGGLNWSTAAMTRVGASSKFRGVVVFPEPTSVNTISSQSGQNGGTNFGPTSQRIAVPFSVTAKARVTNFSALLSRINNGAGQVVAQVYTSDLTTLIAESTPVAVSSISNTADQTVNFKFTQPLLAGSYYVALKVDATFLANLAQNNGGLVWRGGPGSPGYAYFNGTTWDKTTFSNFALVYSLSGTPYDLRVRITSGTAAASLAGYGVFYEEDTLSMPADTEEFQAFDVNGSADQQVFAITNFNVSPRTLKVYDTDNDTVYRFPKFAVNGNTVVFAPGTFLAPGKTIRLIFEQTPLKNGYNTDKLSAVFAANGLGSTDTNFDFSSAGVGIKLRRPDGTMREIALDNNDNIIIKTVP
jgi:hypothetical protein